YIDTIVAAETTTQFKAFTLSQVKLLDTLDSEKERAFEGYMDDMQLYNYAMSEVEVAGLATEGDIPLYVTLGEDVEFKRNSAPLPLVGDILDDGKPGTATLEWSVSVGDESKVSFEPDGQTATNVTFSSDGVYTIRLTADNTESGGSEQVYDEIVVTVTNPTCQHAIDDGRRILTDLNSDCYVNIKDFAILAADWLKCNDPEGDDCEWPW
ncbi:MAG: hypothetical protein MI866_18380, partial [Bacteroidales bacterium]|nr:hypothetical protein [Bacteroidales bacterium]